MVAERMKATGTGGSILNVSSVASRVVLDGGVVYCTLKAGLDHLTHVMAVTLAPYKVQGYQCLVKKRPRCNGEASYRIDKLIRGSISDWLLRDRVRGCSGKSEEIKS